MATQRKRGSTVRRGNIWWIKYSYKGVPVWESTGSRKEPNANKLLAQRLAEITLGDKPFTRANLTVADLVQLVLQDYELRRLKDAKITRYRAEKNILPLMGSVKVTRFGTMHVKEFIKGRRAAGASDATLNRELSIVRRGFSLGLQHDPPLVLRVPHIPKLEEDNVRQGFLERDQYEALRAALPERLRCLFVIGYHLGLRKSTLRALTWEQVDFLAGNIRVVKRQVKQSKAQTVPIYGEMKAWLDMAFAARTPACPFVFQWKGKRIGTHLDGWKAAAAAIGLPELHFHDLRRTAVRNMERAGIPRKIAMSITGHLTESTFRRYDIVDEADLRRAGQKMADYFAAADVLSSNTVAVKKAGNRTKGLTQ